MYYSAQRCVFPVSGRFTTMTVINPPERKLAKRTSVQCEIVEFPNRIVDFGSLCLAGIGWLDRK